jgi:3-hydroxyacyl-[acyl-carrier-protein] dehydratase
VSDTVTTGALGPLDIGRVMAALPHRYPMLLVDRVEELILDRSIAAIKAVTINENFFQGHFPGRPIMPGVLIVEAMAQAAGILAVESLGLAGSGKLVYFMAIDGAKFRKPVEPAPARGRVRPEALERLQVCRPRDDRRAARRRGEFHRDDRGSAQGLTSAQVALTGRLC